MSVFDSLIGQDHVVDVLAEVAASAGQGAQGGAAGMTHAWLFTGPAGSGRSIAARSFAAALQCPDAGCGVCHECHTVQVGTHPDVEVIAPAGLSYSVAETRDLVSRAALSPTVGRWQIVIVEDADRMTEQALNALLKAIEEPPPRTVWMLCAPSTEDLLPTIRSRCRLLTLRIPPPASIAAKLEAEGIDGPVASFAAQASQGHVGRARRLARDEGTRSRRREVLALPTQLSAVPGCFTAAANLVETAAADSSAITDALDNAEAEALKDSQAVTGKGVSRSRSGGGAAMSDLEKRQKSRATRTKRDTLDGALIDLTAFYRDVLVLQIGARVSLINVDLEPTARRIAEHSTPESTVRRIDAILACREAIEANVAPLLAVEAMTLALRAG